MPSCALIRPFLWERLAFALGNRVEFHPDTWVLELVKKNDRLLSFTFRQIELLHCPVHHEFAHDVASSGLNSLGDEDIDGSQHSTDGCNCSWGGTLYTWNERPQPLHFWLCLEKGIKVVAEFSRHLSVINQHTAGLMHADILDAKPLAINRGQSESRLEFGNTCIRCSSLSAKF